MTIGNKTSCRPIYSVCNHCYHLFDYRPNWTPLSPITSSYLCSTCFQLVLCNVFIGALAKIFMSTDFFPKIYYH